MTFWTFMAVLVCVTTFGSIVRTWMSRQPGGSGASGGPDPRIRELERRIAALEDQRPEAETLQRIEVLETIVTSGDDELERKIARLRDV